MDKSIQIDIKNLLTLDEAMRGCFELLSILKSNLKKSDMKRLSDIEKYTDELLKIKSLNVRNTN